MVNLCKGCGDEKVDVIVPDKLSLFMEKFLLEEMNICSSFNIKVSTLNRFAKRSVEIEKEKIISKLGCIMLVHKIMNNNIERLKELKSKAYSFVYAEEVFKTIAQLKAASSYLLYYGLVDYQMICASELGRYIIKSFFTFRILRVRNSKAFLFVKNVLIFCVCKLQTEM